MEQLFPRLITDVVLWMEDGWSYDLAILNVSAESSLDESETFKLKCNTQYLVQFEHEYQ